MLTRIYLSLALLSATSLWAQVASPIQSAPETTGDDQMATPPPVNSNPSPTAVGSEMRSNYLRGGLVLSGSYVDNMYAGQGTNTVGEGIYSVLPTISADQTTSRRHLIFAYRPGFTFYEPTSSLNEVDHNANVDFQYRLTPHGTLGLNDTFQKSSTTYGLSDSTGAATSGSSQPVAPGVLAPFAQRLTNNANGQFSLQIAPAAMVGVSGSTMLLHYPNPSQTSGLYDYDERGASGFYNRRISLGQYAGVNYAYSLILSYPQNGQSNTEMHNLYAFYTIYPKHEFSISASGGVQHYSATQTSLPESRAWEPMIMASVRWQGLHTNLSANYSRQVTGGGGLLGAFTSTNVSGYARWQMARTWTASASANYAVNRSVTPLLLSEAQNGHSIAGFATVEHAFSDQVSLLFEYDRVHQSYEGIASLASDPNSNRELISLVWQFTRPLGR